MPTVVLHPKKEQRVYSGHPWVFRSDIDRVEGPCQDGDVVRVVSSRGRFLAMAVYNPRSQISLRILSRKEEPIDSAFIHRQVKTAIDYRRTFADLNSCRLLFAESDGLPAVIADKFGDIVVLQVLCLGMEQFKQDIVDALAELDQEVEDGMFILMGNDGRATFRKDPDFIASKQGEILYTGQFGSICGLPCLYSKKVPAGTIYVTEKPAIKFLVKKEGSIEQDRDIETKDNTVVYERHGLIALVDDTRSIIVTEAAE